MEASYADALILTIGVMVLILTLLWSFIELSYLSTSTELDIDKESVTDRFLVVYFLLCAIAIAILVLWIESNAASSVLPGDMSALALLIMTTAWLMPIIIHGYGTSSAKDEEVRCSPYDQIQTAKKNLRGGGQTPLRATIQTPDTPKPGRAICKKCGKEFRLRKSSIGPIRGAMYGGFGGSVFGFIVAGPVGSILLGGYAATQMGVEGLGEDVEYIRDDTCVSCKW